MPIENVDAFLNRDDRIAIEVCGTNLNNRNTLGVITSAGGARSIELATRFFF
jgi:hypothetical protein